MIYEEHAHYEEMQRNPRVISLTQGLPRQVSTDGSTAAGHNRTVTFFRRWPGDSPGDQEALLEFEFNNDFVGPLEVCYSEEGSEPFFSLKDQGSSADTVTGEWIRPKYRLPPMQRGDL